LVDVSAKQDNSVCMIMVLPNSYEFFILGQPFFQNNYMTFSMEKSTVTITPGSWSTKKTPQTGGIPIQTFRPSTTSSSSSSGNVYNPSRTVSVGWGTFWAIMFIFSAITVYYSVAHPYITSRYTPQANAGIQVIFWFALILTYQFLIVPFIGSGAPNFLWLLGVITTETICNSNTNNVNCQIDYNVTNPYPYTPYDPYYDPNAPYYRPYDSWSSYNYHKNPKFIAASLLAVSVVGVKLFGKRNTEEAEKNEPENLLSMLAKNGKTFKTNEVPSTINYMD